MNTAGAHELGYASAAIVAALLDRLISYIHAIVENKEKRLIVRMKISSFTMASTPVFPDSRKSLTITSNCKQERFFATRLSPSPTKAKSE